MKMKKLFLLITLFGLATLNVVAQDDTYLGTNAKGKKEASTKAKIQSSQPIGSDRDVDEYNRHYSTKSNVTNNGDGIDVLQEPGEDDMYFIPKKSSKKDKKKVVQDNTPAYYVGTNRSVDEYNRHKKLVSTYQKIGIDSLGNDIVRIFSENEIYPDTSYVDTLFMVSRYVNSEDDYRYSSNLSRWDDYYYYNTPYDIWRNYSWWGYYPYSWPAYMYGRSWAWHFHGGYYGYYSPWYNRWGYYDPWYDPWYMSLYYGGYYDPYYFWYSSWWYFAYDPWYYNRYYGIAYVGYGGYGGYGGRHHSNSSVGTTSGKGDIRYTGAGTYNHSRSASGGGVGGSVHSTTNRNIFSRNTNVGGGTSGASGTSGTRTTRTYTTNSSGAKFGGSRSTVTYGGNTPNYSAPTYNNSSSISSSSSYSGSSGSFGGSSGGGGGGGGRSGGGGGGGRSGGGSFGGHR